MGHIEFEYHKITIKCHYFEAINNTTVEVTFKEDVKDLAALNFAIEGLTIDGKVLKQTDAKTVVLTTAAQTAGTTYAVTVNGETVGSFTGVAEVIPTKIDVTTKSVQGVIGEQVSLTAKVTVPEGQSVANVPVTFNVTSDTTNNEKKEATVLTNAEGVATYTYTRYYNGTDSFAAYATKKSTVVSTGKVYWAAAKQLTVKDITEATTLVNGAKKTYQIESAKNAGKYVFVTFQENLAKTPDKLTTDVKIEGLRTYSIDAAGKITGAGTVGGYPYETTTGGKAVTAVLLDANGKANLVLTGSDAEVSPIVFEGVFGTTNYGTATWGDDLRDFSSVLYDATALQAKASTVKFELKHELGLTIAAEGNQNAATWTTFNGSYDTKVNAGGRDFTVTYTDKDGKVAKKGTKVQIAVPVAGFKNASQVAVLNAAGNSIGGAVNSGYIYAEVTIGNEGKAKFSVISQNENDYVTPVAFIDSDLDLTLDKNELQVSPNEATYFIKKVTYNAALKALYKGEEVTEELHLGSEYEVEYVYTLVDQNGKVRTADASTPVTFTLNVGTGKVSVNGTVYGPGVHEIVASTINSGSYNAGSYSASIKAYALEPTNLKVSAVGTVAGVVLAPSNEAVVAFRTGTSATVANGKVLYVNKAADTFVVQNNINGNINTISYAASEVAEYKIGGEKAKFSEFEAALSYNDVVSATKNADGLYVLNIITNDSTTATSGTINSSTEFNQVLAVAPDNSEFDVNISGDLTVTTTRDIDFKITGSISGDLIVNAPNSHIELGSSTLSGTVSGDVHVVDVAGSSFVIAATGTVGGDIQISDDNAKVEVKSGGTLTGNVILDGKGKQVIELLGTSGKTVTVGKDVTAVEFSKESVFGPVTVKNSATTLTQNGSTVGKEVETSKGTTGVITLDDAEYIAEATTRALVTLKDVDLDTNPAVAEKVTVQVTYGTTTTNLELTENAVASGEFVGYVTGLSTKGDLKVSYTDVKTTSGTVEAVKAEAKVITQADADQAAALKVAQDKVVAGTALVADFTTAGFTGVTASNVSAVNALIKAKSPADFAAAKTFVTEIVTAEASPVVGTQTTEAAANPIDSAYVAYKFKDIHVGNDFVGTTIYKADGTSGVTLFTQAELDDLSEAELAREAFLMVPNTVKEETFFYGINKTGKVVVLKLEEIK